MKYRAIVGNRVFNFSTSKAAEAFAEKNQLKLWRAFVNDKKGIETSIFYNKKDVRR
jgi:hypothetical protein